MELQVRAATVAEVALVSEILTEAVAWLQERGTPLWAPAEVSISGLEPDVQGGLYFLAWSGPSAVGTMRLPSCDPVFWPEAVQGEALYLHRLAVRRAVAGGPVSSLLLRWAVAPAAERGARYLRLDCEASRSSLRAFYERFGFALHSERCLGPLVIARYQLQCAHAI